MNRCAGWSCLVLVNVVGLQTMVANESHINPRLAAYVAQRESEFDQISAERQAQLQLLSDYLRKCRAAGKPIKLTFICTHNSRRSHLSQLWGQVAAVHYGFDKVETFSGGTESTAFNPRAVAALRRAGFDIEQLDKSKNPRYKVAFAARALPVVCFSKVYTDAPNPARDFCAVLTCSSADQACPTVTGASQRVAISYEDPKVADDTPQEAAVYDERAAQIARELLYAFSQADS